MPARRVPAAWGDLLSDYEIGAPFLQLGRPIYGLDPGEEIGMEITRFGSVTLPAAG